MSGCDSDGLIHVGENLLFFIGCHNYLYLRFSDEKSVHWQIQPGRQNQTLDLVCGESDPCTTHPEMNATFGHHFSYLSIFHVERSMFNSSTITCSVSTNGSDISANASCLIDVTCEYVVVQRVTSIVIIHISQ